MSGDGGSRTRTVEQTSTQEPPEYAKPYFEELLAEAKTEFTSDRPKYYPGSTIVDRSPQSELALQMTESAALGGSPIVDAAQNVALAGITGNLPTSANAIAADRLNSQILAGNYLTPQTAAGRAAYDLDQRTIAGEFLDAENPYFSKAVEAASRPVTSQVGSMFSRGGRYGSGANQDVLSRSIGDISSKMAYQNYAQERANQIAAQNRVNALEQAGRARQDAAASASMNRELQNRAQRMQFMGMVPGLRNLDFADAQKIAGVGAARDAEAQARLSADIDRFNFGQNVGRQKLGDYASLVRGGTFGGTTTSISPQFYNPAANYLGLGLGAASLGSMLFGAPVPGVAAGGLLRGLRI